MKKLAMVLGALAICLSAKSEVQAQVPYVTYYQPVVAYHAPAVVVPQTVYYAPAPAPVVYQPTARVRTRYRPILGGTVSRVRYGYAPAYYAPAPVVYAY